MSAQPQDTSLGSPIEDPSVVCGQPSEGTRGVYTVITDIESGRSYAVVAFRTYMQENAISETRPAGHMYCEFLIDTSKQRTLPHNQLGQDHVTKLPFPCFSVWWRAIVNGVKYKTKFLEFYAAGTKQDAILEQNVCE